jgi:putative ABC transport system ATP-binding protein
MVLKHVHKVYPMGESDVHALAEINIRFQQGSFWAIMGASGSGKSTMLNILGCLDRPSAGQYLFEGRDVGSLNDDELSRLRLRRIGFIFQNFNLIPQLTVLENIELPMNYLGLDSHASAERAKGLADHVGLGDHLRHRPTELSGGQQQRVAIARALANDPAILLADEPTGNLDSETGEQIIQMLTALHGQGRTIIMVTHESTLAQKAGKRIQMHDGKIKEIH